MTPSYPFERLALDSIRPGTWSLHQDLSIAPPSALDDSIKRFGLFQPPVVRRMKNDFELICGRTRLEIYRRYFSSDFLICKLIPANGCTADILRTVLEDQLLSGPLTAIMTARLLFMCNKELPKDDVDAFLAEAGLNPARCRRLLPLLELEPEVRNAVHCSVLSEKTALDLLSMNPEDRTFLLDLVAHLGLNGNKQKRLIEFCRIITGMTHQPIKDFFTLNFEDITNSEVLDNTPQKSAAVLKKLYELSHPYSTRAENEFHQRIHALNLPKNYSVHHSPSFEKDEITLEIKLENIDQLEKKLKEFI